MISANARLYEYVMPFGIVCSPPVYQFTNLPIYSRTQVGHASTYRRQHMCRHRSPGTIHDDIRTNTRRAGGQPPRSVGRRPPTLLATLHRLRRGACCPRRTPSAPCLPRGRLRFLLPFLLPTFVDVALAAALGGEPPHLTLPLTLPIDLPALPPIGGRW